MDDYRLSGSSDQSFDIKSLTDSITSLNLVFKTFEKELNALFKKMQDGNTEVHKDALAKIEEEAEAERKKQERKKSREAEFNELKKKALDEYWAELQKKHNKEKKDLEEQYTASAEYEANKLAAAKLADKINSESFARRKKAEEEYHRNIEARKAKSALTIAEYQESLDERYAKAKQKHLEEAIKREAAKKGKAVEELTEKELEHAQEVADASMLDIDKWEKLQKKKDDKENKKEVGNVVEWSKADSVGVNFKNAFTGTVGAAKDAVKNKLSTFVSRNEDSGNLDITGAANALGSFAEKLDSKIQEAAGHKTKIDTRLYGSEANLDIGGSYWTALNASIMSIAGASPLFLQTDMITSLEKLVDTGISHNLKLRAFLDVTSDKIASTFEVADSTLLRLVRIQQQDTTAARLGMESALNAFLNNMFETTEYLSSLADSVRGNLVEAQALMGAKDATEFEYQVQKWMGSMYSVGMSDSTVTNIATTLGQLAAGEIDALTGGNGTGNLMIMAANSAGISIADILKDGLDAETTNKLLQATVDYLAQIAQQSDSKVIQQQLAGIFGMKASDLKSVMNLASDNKTIKNIANNNLSNESMLLELAVRAATMTSRVDMGTMMNNMWENVQYSIASGIANNPATFALYKMAGLLQDSIGGIPISFLNVYGFGVDLNTSIAQLMQLGALAGGVMSSLPMMLGGLASAAGGGAAMLAAAGIATQGQTISRGTGSGAAGALALSGAGTSESGLIGNGSTSDMQGATMAGGQDSIDAQGTQGKEENEDATRDDIIEILKMLFGSLGDKIDENTEAVKGTGSVFNSNDNTMVGFTNAATTKNSGW